MGRPAKNTFTLQDGRLVGYGLTDRGGSYRVRFQGPDGKRWEETTGCDTKNDARNRAAVIIVNAYFPTPQSRPMNFDWDQAVGELDKTPGLRPDTLRNYKTVIRVFRHLMPEVSGPAAVNVNDASRFKRVYLGSKTQRGNRPTTPVSCRTYLRSLRSLWSQHFRELGIVVDNPWLQVAYPEVAKKDVVIPDEDHFQKFFDWLTARYPNWPLIHLYVRIKSMAATRTLDLCAALSSELKNGRLTLTHTKTKKTRTVPLPDDVFAELKKLAGKTYLWEQFTADAKVHRHGQRSPDVFSPETLKTTVSNIFREYNETHPDAKVKPHDLRKRGITLTTMATQSVDATANALGLDPQTARRYYNDASKAFDAEALMNRMASVLDPSKNVTKSSPNSGKTGEEQGTPGKND